MSSSVEQPIKPSEDTTVSHPGIPTTATASESKVEEPKIVETTATTTVASATVASATPGAPSVTAEAAPETTPEGETAAGGGASEFYPEEEVLEGDWMRPQVNIKEVEVKTGEEDEECFWKHRAKLYRWAKDIGEWKERGLGDAKLLRHKQSRKIRFLLRQEKTLKIAANHYVVKHGSFCNLTPNVGSDKIWVWSVTDFSDDEPKVEQFGLKFGQVEAATEFKTKFEEAAALNEECFKAVIEKTKTAITAEEAGTEKKGE